MTRHKFESIQSMENTGEGDQSYNWLYGIRKILIDNLKQIDVFVAHLGTSKFNATAKWDQLTTNIPSIDSRFYKFMDLWNAGSGHSKQHQIVSALKAINRYDIVKIIEEDRILNEHLNMYENNIVEDPDKPKWFKATRLILIKDLKNPDVFFIHLGDQRLNLSAKWEQFSSLDVESRFFKVMDIWYEGNSDPCLTQIISALEEIKRNDIVTTIKADDNLRAQLRNGNKSPIQAVGDIKISAPQSLCFDII